MTRRENGHYAGNIGSIRKTYRPQFQYIQVGILPFSQKWKIVAFLDPEVIDV